MQKIIFHHVGLLYIRY